MRFYLVLMLVLLVCSQISACSKYNRKDYRHWIDWPAPFKLNSKLNSSFLIYGQGRSHGPKEIPSRTEPSSSLARRKTNLWSFLILSAIRLLRHRTLSEIRNSPPSTLHPPRYQTEKGVVELLGVSGCQISSLLHSFLPLLASRIHPRHTEKGANYGWLDYVINELWLNFYWICQYLFTQPILA